MQAELPVPVQLEGAPNERKASPTTNTPCSGFERAAQNGEEGAAGERCSREASPDGAAPDGA